MYQVIDRTGQAFGPVPLETLRQWALENRVTPEMTVVDQETGQQGLAGQVLAGLEVFPEAAPAPQPQAPVQPVSYAYKGSTEPGMAPMLQTRFIAFLIDYLLAIVVYVAIETTINLLMLQVDAQGWSLWGYLSYFYPAVMTLFLVLRDAFFPGQSIGKRIANLKVISTAGQHVNALHSIFRNLASLPVCLLSIKYLGSWIALPLVIALFGFECFMVLTTGQRMGDKLAHTNVVNA